jgi:hypothetical protein
MPARGLLHLDVVPGRPGSRCRLEYRRGIGAAGGQHAVVPGDGFTHARVVKDPRPQC